MSTHLAASSGGTENKAALEFEAYGQFLEEFNQQPLRQVELLHNIERLVDFFCGDELFQKTLGSSYKSCTEHASLNHNRCYEAVFIPKLEQEYTRKEMVSAIEKYLSCSEVIPDR